MPTTAVTIGALVLVLAIAGVLLGQGYEIAATGVLVTGAVAALVGWMLRREQARALAAAQAARTDAEAATRRMALLADVGRVTVGALTVQDVADGLVDLLVPRIGDLCSVEVIDAHDEPRTVAARWTGPNEEEIAERLRGSSPGDPERQALLQELQLTSHAAIPLAAGGRSLGTLHLGVGPSGRAYDAADLALFGLMAGRASLAIGNAGLLEEVTATREQLDQTLATMAEAVTVTDRQRRIRYANQAAADLLGFETPADLMRAEVASIYGRWISTLEDGTPLDPEQVPSWRVVQGLDAEPLLTHVVDRQTGESRWRLVKAAPLRRPSGELLAVTVIEDVTEVKEAELRERFLARAGAALATSLSHTETLQRVASLAVPALADWCAVDVVDARGIAESVAVAHVDPNKVAYAREMRERFPPQRDAEAGLYAVLRSGKPELYAHVPEELLSRLAQGPEHLRMIASLGLRSVMIVPMSIGGRTIGAITFVAAESQRVFDEDDVEFASELARRAASAVENARLYSERVQIAQTLQESLLPARLPRIPGWRTAVAYQPGENAEIGGDFYDLIDVDGGFLVVVGDVTGKGVQAAALTALARYTLATAARFDPSPSAVVRLLNQVLAERSSTSLLTVSCALVQAQPDAVVVRVVCAGHPPPLLHRDGGEASALECAGLLLGVTRDATWQETELELQPGDTLLFYTDGVIDTPGELDRFGEGRLLTVCSEGPAEPSAMIGRLDRALRAHQRGGVSDDRAMLALQLVALDAAAAGEVIELPGRTGAAPR